MLHSQACDRQMCPRCLMLSSWMPNYPLGLVSVPFPTFVCVWGGRSRGVRLLGLVQVCERNQVELRAMFGPCLMLCRQ